MINKIRKKQKRGGKIIRKEKFQNEQRENKKIPKTKTITIKSEETSFIQRLKITVTATGDK